MPGLSATEGLVAFNDDALNYFTCRARAGQYAAMLVRPLLSDGEMVCDFDFKPFSGTAGDSGLEVDGMRACGQRSQLSQ